MSIGKRLIDLARSELNALLDKAAEIDDRHQQDEDGWGELSSLSDEELEAELERRRRAREEAEEAATGRKSAGRAGAPPRAERAGGAPGGRTANGSRRADPPPRRTASGDDAIRKAYAALEVPPGSDFETIRKAYRRLMRKYHPDLHRASPEAQKAATDLTQRLTEAYKLLEKQARR
jgi:DnaJ-domain-containing protein 1